MKTNRVPNIMNSYFHVQFFGISAGKEVELKSDRNITEKYSKLSRGENKLARTGENGVMTS